MTTFTSDERSKIRNTLADPIKFVLHWLGSDLWSVQRDICKALLKPQAKVNVKACHSSGKTFLAAQITLWWLARYENAIVVTTAPTKKQVEVLMWGEIHKALVKSKYPFPSANLTKLEFNKTKYPIRYALGFTTTVQQQDEGVKFQGFHADHVLIIIDEAPGVDPKIIEAIEGIRAGGDVRILKLGNPTISSGAFYDEFHSKRASVQPFTISAFDTPNFKGIKLSYEAQDSEGAPITVTLGDPNGRDLMDLSEEELDQNVMPWLTTRRWVKERFEEWGPGDFRWDSRVMGDFPSQSPDALLSLAWLERAQRDTRTFDGKVDIGIDVAGPGEDETVMCARCGFQILEIVGWGNPDPRGELVSALRKYGDRIGTLNVDSAGIGYYLHKHLQDLGFPSNAVNVGESPADKEQFVNLKAELYWGLRMRAKSGDLSGLDDETAISQLASIRWKPNSRGQTEIESKEAMRKRGVKALSVDTPIPTPQGVRLLADLHAGDYVFGEDGNPVRIKAETEIMEGLPCYRVTFSGGTEIVAEAGHLWKTHQRYYEIRHTRKNLVGIRTTSEISQSLMNPHPGAKWNHRVRQHLPLQLPEADLPISPYVLGAWLGDGDSDSPRITIGERDRIEQSKEIEREGVSVSPTKNPTRFKLGGDGKKTPNKGIRSQLSRLGVLNNKHIPLMYLRASSSQRLALLQGLLDTDGTIDAKRGRVEISSSYENISAGIRDLLSTFGLKYSESSYLPQRGKMVTRFQFMAYKDMPVFRIKRKADRQIEMSGRVLLSEYQAIVGCEKTESVPVKCITVESPSGMFLAGKGMIPTHNSPDRAEAIMLAFAKVAKNGAGLLEYYQGITAVQTGGDQDSNPKTPGFRPAPTITTPVKAPALTAYNRAMAALAPQDLCDHCGRPLGDTVVEEGIRRMHPDCARPSWAS